FLDSLALNSLTKNSQILLDFLSIEKDSEFSQKKKEFLKIKPPAKLSDMKTSDGTLKVKVSKEMEAYADHNIKTYTNVNEALLKKLSTSYKHLFMEMNQVSLRMKEL